VPGLADRSGPGATAVTKLGEVDQAAALLASFSGSQVDALRDDVAAFTA